MDGNVTLIQSVRSGIRTLREEMDGNSVHIEIVFFHSDLQQQTGILQSFMADSCYDRTEFLWKVGNQKLNLH